MYKLKSSEIYPTRYLSLYIPHPQAPMMLAPGQQPQMVMQPVQQGYPVASGYAPQQQQGYAPPTVRNWKRKKIMSLERQLGTSAGEAAVAGIHAALDELRWSQHSFKV
jgi:hypothetical protein